jgi:hypothetical protein
VLVSIGPLLLVQRITAKSGHPKGIPYLLLAVSIQLFAEIKFCVFCPAAKIDCQQ